MFEGLQLLLLLWRQRWRTPAALIAGPPSSAAAPTAGTAGTSIIQLWSMVTAQMCQRAGRACRGAAPCTDHGFGRVCWAREADPSEMAGANAGLPVASVAGGSVNDGDVRGAVCRGRRCR